MTKRPVAASRQHRCMESVVTGARRHPQAPVGAKKLPWRASPASLSACGRTQASPPGPASLRPARACPFALTGRSTSNDLIVVQRCPFLEILLGEEGVGCGPSNRSMLRSRNSR